MKRINWNLQAECWPVAHPEDESSGNENVEMDMWTYQERQDFFETGNFTRRDGIQEQRYSGQVGSGPLWWTIQEGEVEIVQTCEAKIYKEKELI